ncbi:MAG: nuclear transport factor 2 family protein [Solirubrobacteraceae bacterium]
MANINDTVQSYIAMWNETDAEARRSLVAQTVTDDATYLDPMLSGSGVDGIAEMIGAAQAQFPGLSFTLSAGPEEHHDKARFSWRLGPGNGDTVAAGTDFVTLGADGRMQSIIGFLDVSP